MARTNKVEVEITASDEATPKIERLERKIDGLESDEARIIVTAQTDRLEQQLADAKQKLEGLDGDEASVQIRAIGNLEAELEQAQTLFTQLDGKTGTVRINAVDKASKELDQVTAKMRQLDGETARVRTSAAGIVGGVAGGIGLAALPGIIADAAQQGANLAIEVDNLAGLTGASLEDASRLVGQFATAGVEASDLADIMLNVNQVLRDNPELAAELGVKIGENTTLIETFVQAVDGVSTSYDNAGDRAVAASQLFGEEGVSQVNAVTTALDTDLATALEQFQGPIITDEAVDNAREMSAQINTAKADMQEIALLIMPAVTAGLGALADYFNGVAAAGAATRDWFEDHPRLSGEDILGMFGIPDPTPSAPVTATGSRRTEPGGTVNYFFPPGVSPPAVVQADRIYQRRNGIQ